MAQLTTIELEKQDMHFSAAHFTIFSSTRRERLHGHNFYVAAEITGFVGDDGLCFDYVGVKKILRELCRQYDEYTLVAGDSPYQVIAEQDNFYRIGFNGEDILLRKDETLILPIRNTTIEELAQLLMEQLIANPAFQQSGDIVELVVKVSSGPGQWGKSHWTKPGYSVQTDRGAHQGTHQDTI